MSKTPNDDRSNSMNPNNDAYWASANNHSNQLNPNNSAYYASREHNIGDDIATYMPATTSYQTQVTNQTVTEDPIEEGITFDVSISEEQIAVHRKFIASISRR